MIPLSRPIRSNLDPNETVSHISVKRGQILFIPITAVNHSKEIFGPDASEFRPERWLGAEADKIQGKVGVYSSTLTFLAGCVARFRHRFRHRSSILTVLAGHVSQPEELHRLQVCVSPLSQICACSRFWKLTWFCFVPQPSRTQSVRRPSRVTLFR